MIDTLHSLAFSVQSNPGVYAVLLGSGVSRSAQVPTGWEITIDLIRKLAALSDEDCEPSPEKWYLDKFGREPDYSELLDELVKTPAERQQLLRSYLEASEEERDEGIKQPTAAHRAIASMAAKGYVRVIITTNFDRLMENALADAGVVPTVLSSPDQVQGALPLIHTQCCVFKVHGDYLDPRIRNTNEELESYPEEFDSLLDRIIDEFGLIICGWSSEWDEALRNAILRATSRRFTTYWASRNSLGEWARKLISHRQAQEVKIEDADAFFKKLDELVQSIEEFSRPHPLSAQAAISSIKRFISDSKYRIQFDDLVGGEVGRIEQATKGEKFACQNVPQPDTASFTSRIKAYEASCEILLSIAPIGGYWAEPQHYITWKRALIQLASQPTERGYTAWLDLRRYPATLLLYALGLGALEAGNLDLLGALFGSVIRRENAGEKMIVEVLPPFALFCNGSGTAKLLEGMERNYAPLNDRLHVILRSYVKRVIGNDERFTHQFDHLEILMALSFIHHRKRVGDYIWAPPGAYGYRHNNRDQILSEISQSLDNAGDNSVYVSSKIFGENADDCKKVLSEFRDWLKNLNWF